MNSEILASAQQSQSGVIWTLLGCVLVWLRPCCGSAVALLRGPLVVPDPKAPSGMLQTGPDLRSISSSRKNLVGSNRLSTQDFDSSTVKFEICREG